jgi:ribosomal small subunit protein bTHX
MGKGDRKSKRGKIHRGTYGKRRPKKLIPVPGVQSKKPEETKNQ